MGWAGSARWDSFCLTPFLASKHGLCVHIFLFLTPNYYQSHCVISHHLTQQMAIFHPITPHLLSLLYLSSHKHCYVLPRLTPLSHLSSSVYHLPLPLSPCRLCWDRFHTPDVQPHPGRLCPLSVPELLSFWTFPRPSGEHYTPGYHGATSATFSSGFNNLLFQRRLTSLTLALRRRTVRWDVRRLHGAGLCHLSHARQASPNQDGAAWLPLAERWETLWIQMANVRINFRKLICLVDRAT